MLRKDSLRIRGRRILVVHEKESPLSGTTVKLVHHDRVFRGELASFTVGDWWDRIQNTSWKNSTDVLAVNYTWRRKLFNLPDDDNVLYGRLSDGLEKLIHVSEIEDF